MAVFTKGGKLSSKVSARCTVKRALKIEQIVRLTGEGFKDDAIALVMGITPQYVSMLRRTPEYIAVDAQVKTGIIARYDRHLFSTIDAQRAELEEMLPEATTVLRSLLLNRMNPRLQLEAAKEIMDREGSLAKVSKTEIKKTVEYDFTQHDKELEDDLLSALQAGGEAVKDGDIEGFINAKLDPEAQTKLHEAVEKIRLEDLQTSTAIN